MPDSDYPTTGELRRSANRLVQLGLLRAFTTLTRELPNGAGTVTHGFRFETTAGETITLRRREAAGYLRGLAHGSYVERTEAGEAPRGA